MASQQLRRVQRAAAGAIGDLVAAARAVGDNDRIGRRAHRRQQARLGHLHRDLVVRGFIAEAAGHAAARAFDQRRLRAGNQAQHLEDRLDRAECFLVAMRMHEQPLGHGPQWRREAARLRLARDELFEQQRLPRDRFGLLTEAHHERLVAQRQQARRLEADDRHAGLGERQQRVDQRLGPVLRRGDHAARQVGAPAAVVRTVLA